MVINMMTNAHSIWNLDMFIFRSNPLVEFHQVTKSSVPGSHRAVRGSLGRLHFCENHGIFSTIEEKTRGFFHDFPILQSAS